MNITIRTILPFDTIATNLHTNETHLTTAKFHFIDDRAIYCFYL